MVVLLVRQLALPTLPQPKLQCVARFALVQCGIDVHVRTQEIND